MDTKQQLLDIMEAIRDLVYNAVEHGVCPETEQARVNVELLFQDARTERDSLQKQLELLGSTNHIAALDIDNLAGKIDALRERLAALESVGAEKVAKLLDHLISKMGGPVSFYDEKWRAEILQSVGSLASRLAEAEEAVLFLWKGDLTKAGQEAHIRVLMKIKARREKTGGGDES